MKVLPSARMTFQVELKLVNAILQEIGREELVLPAELDGMTVTADLPRAVVAMYGDCERSLEEARQAGYDPDDPAAAPLLPGCTTFTQMRSPEIHAPAGLDLTSLGEI